MPSFYASGSCHRPLKELDGESILPAREIEDEVAQLATLTKASVTDSRGDDPR